MLVKIYIAGAVATMLVLLFFLTPTKTSSRWEGAANLAKEASCVILWPLLLLWVVYEFVFLWFWEIDDSESES